ncbi:MAG TPA: tagaturonate epimerase family protein [Prolixibacteraceae bacterium]|nr:tagaturonate epimerase family protein [Prolixibacteraceae bacterium]
MKKIGKYSFGVGDRFGHQGKAQLKAFIAAKEELGMEFTPVWNKSFREHSIIGTVPSEVRKEADEAVKALGWKGDYYVDADHINFKNVDTFVEPSDFFTIDVADFIGEAAPEESVTAFVKAHQSYVGKLSIPGIEVPLQVSEEWLKSFANKYLTAMTEASKVYRFLAEKKGVGNFVPEVSCDETDTPQSPLDLFFILKLLADNKVPAQTIAPRFSGRFNKGVDYVGDVALFEREFEQDLLVIDFAVKQFGLPDNLKLSVHSGSDKFSIYPIIGKLIKKHNKGIHIKTAGTTWLEEIAGLALSDGAGLALAKEVYASAYKKMDELTAPYASVIDIRKERLPVPEEVASWTGRQFADAVIHNQSNPAFNPDLRQLIHVGYKVAAQKGNVYYAALEKFEDNIEKQVFENIFTRHMKLLKV